MTFSLSNSRVLHASGTALPDPTLVGGTTALTDGSTSTYASNPTSTEGLIEMDLNGDPTPPTGATLATIVVSALGSLTSSQSFSRGGFQSYIVPAGSIGVASNVYGSGVAGPIATAASTFTWIPGASPSTLSRTFTITASTMTSFLGSSGVAATSTSTNSFRIRPVTSASGTTFIYEVSLTWTWNVPTPTATPPMFARGHKTLTTPLLARSRTTTDGFHARRSL